MESRMVNCAIVSVVFIINSKLFNESKKIELLSVPDRPAGHDA